MKSDITNKMKTHVPTTSLINLILLTTLKLSVSLPQRQTQSWIWCLIFPCFKKQFLKKKKTILLPCIFVCLKNTLFNFVHCWTFKIWLCSICFPICFLPSVKSTDYYTKYNANLWTKGDMFSLHKSNFKLKETLSNKYSFNFIST